MLTGLSDTIHASQQAFRQLLHAMSEPGSIAAFDNVPSWHILNPASVAVLLTLCDQNTTLYFSPELYDEKVLQAMQFHTQARIGEADSADFIFTTPEAFAPDHYYHGDDMYPENGATVILQTSSLTEGRAITLTGPGIENDRVISPSLSQAVYTHYESQPARYPLGIDTLITHKSSLLAVPRTTKVRVN